MGAFLSSAEQVFIMLILMLLGFILAKRGILSEKGTRDITDLVLYFVTPCVIIKSFSRPFDKETLGEILLCFALALGIHIGAILIAQLCIHSKTYARKSVLRYSVVFANCGYMALPLLQALVGEDGVLYGTAFIAVFNLLAWSYGIVLMSGDKSYISPKKMLINPGIIGISIGLVIFLCSIELPDIIYRPIEHLSFLNTPLPMIIIGYHLSKASLKRCFSDINSLLAIALRLLVVPLLTIGALYLLNIRGSMLLAMIISAASPIAANTTMFAAKFSQDSELSVNMVSFSTVLSVLTIPIMVFLARLI